MKTQCTPIQFEFLPLEHRNSSTLNRLELGDPETARSNRYKRIAGDNDGLPSNTTKRFQVSRPVRY